MALKEFLKTIADAIRTKKGTTEPINAQNFATEIANLPSGTNTSDATVTPETLFKDETAYGANGKITGTFTIDSEISTQDDLITQIAIALQKKSGVSVNPNLLEVPQLPTTNIESDKIYLVNSNIIKNTEVYFVAPEGYFTLKQLIITGLGITPNITYSVVNTLPETPNITDIATFSTVYCYIYNDVSYVYGDAGSGNMWITISALASQVLETPVTDAGRTQDITTESVETPSLFVYYEEKNIQEIGAPENSEVYDWNGTEWVQKGAVVIEKGGYTGTTLNSTNYTGTVYFNINLTPQEINSIIDNAELTWIEDEGGQLYPFLAMDIPNSNGGTDTLHFILVNLGVGYAAIDYGGSSLILFHTINNTEMIDDLGFIGWNHDIIPSNGQLPLGGTIIEDEMWGKENDKLSGLVSASPIIETQPETTMLSGTYEWTTLQLSSNGTTDVKSIIENDKKIPKCIVVENYTSKFKQFIEGELQELTAEDFEGSKHIIPFAFCHCSSLTSVEIPNTVTSIGDSAFENCSGLASVVIPDSVTSIGGYAFRGCSSLTIYCEATSKPSGWNSNWNSSNLPVYWYSESHPTDAGNYWHYDENGVITVWCNEIVIYSAVAPTCTTTGLTEGKHCATCGEVLVSQEIVNALGHTEVVDSAVAPTCTTTGLTEGKHCSVCDAVLVAQEIIPASHTYQDGNCSVCGETSTEYFTFTLLNDDTYKVIAKDVNNIPAEVKIPASYNGKAVTAIGFAAFDGCTSLTSIVIPNSVTKINGFYAFRNCTSLTSVEIPESLTLIWYQAFDGCSSLTSVNYLGTIDQWAQITFSDGYANPLYYAESLKINGEVVTQANLRSTTKISSFAFRRYGSLTSVVIPDSVTSIGDYAFAGCSNLKDIYYGGTVETWLNISGLNYLMDASSSKNLYFNNQLVTDLIIPNTVMSIPSFAFRSCVSLTSIEISDSVTSIGGCAFELCSSLVSVVIPNSVTLLDNYAFELCSSLANITFNGTITQWNAITKGNSWNYNVPATKVVCTDGEVTL